MFNKNAYLEILDFIEKNEKNVKIVAISKNHPAESIESALLCGVRVFGENRVQEAINKFSEIKRKNKNIELHLTGPLQTNKVKLALSIFDTFQTLDREKLANEFIKYFSIIKEKNFFVQINTGKEKSKSGIFPEDANSFISYCVFDLKIPIVGLMCIPPSYENSKIHFNILKKIALKNNIKNLSMGMSNDFKEGILCGASHIRVGTKLFGLRE